MVKKIIMWTIYAGIVGLLIFGAVNRTAAKTDQGVLFGSTNEEAGDGQERGGLGNPEQSNDLGEVEHNETLEDHDWAEIGGVILKFDSKYLIIQTDNNSELELSGRAWRFILESGYMPAEGSELRLSGFYENGEYKIVSFQDQDSAQIIMVRDSSGQPLWR